MNVTPTVVRLPEETRTRIRKLVGDTGMAGFLREAAEEKLDRDERQAKKGKKPSR